MPPSVQNGAREPAFTAPFQQPDPRVFAHHRGDNLLGPVAAVVIHDDHFPGNVYRIENLLTLRSRGPRFAASFNAGMTSTSFSPTGTGLARLSARLYDVTVAADEILSNFTSIPGRAWRRFHDSLFILLLTAAGFAAMGYHPGFEDDGIYLSAVKSDLNPALYPHDADFFRLQVQATVV